MKKVNRRRLFSIRIILCLCFLLASAVIFEFYKSQNTGKDMTPPVLRVYGNDPVYQEGSDPGELIANVQAEDDVDGNVSDTIRVRSIYYKEGSDEATVTYVAKDRSNNLGFIRRTVHVERSQTETPGETQESDTTEVSPAGN